ncbi:MAG: hypothetical protein EB059_04210 [Alphaproteobacteria bacterium]|nr:hypothetical protein [Alphaproteobacteria bacterium]
MKQGNISKHYSGFQIPAQLARMCFAILVIFLYPTVGFSAAGSVGDTFCKVFDNVKNFPPLFSGIAYITGAWIVVRGLFDMMKRAADPNNKAFKDGILGVMMGSMVAALPPLINWLHKSVLGKQVAGSGIQCGVGAAGGGTGVPLDVMLTNFVGNIAPAIIPLISAMAVIFGVIMIFYNMVKLSKFGTDAKTSNLTPIIGSLIIGALLVAVGETMDVSLNTIFGDTAVKKYDALAYVPGGGFDMTKFDNAMKAVFSFLYIVGSLSFVRGFFVMKNALEGSGQATKGQAYTHIIGGTLLVNMPGFIEIVGKTVGFDMIAVH